MESFTRIDNEIFDAGLPWQARFLWMVVRSFEHPQKGCFASVKTIADRAGWQVRNVRRVWGILVSTGYGEEETYRGRCSVRRVKFPDTPVISCTGASNTPGDPCTPAQNDRGECHSPLAIHAPAPGDPCTRTSTIKNNTEKKEEHPPSPLKGESVSSKPPKPTRTPKGKNTRESVEIAIDAIDIESFRKKYPYLDIDKELRDFKTHFLDKNDKATGKPNWIKWSDWNKAFHNWCNSPWKKTQTTEPEWMK